MQAKTRSQSGQCRFCKRSFTSWVRLQHHWAAEHALKTSQDIRTSRNIRTLSDTRTVRDAAGRQPAA